MQRDVRSIDYSAFAHDVDVVAGGPPCQPFSLGGKHRAFLDDRDMFPEAVRAVREVRPKAFIFENVKGLLRPAFSSYFEYITLQLTYPSFVRKPKEEWSRHLSRLEKHHTSAKGNPEYKVVFRLLNAADFGVPQKRERVLIVGIRSDLNLSWSFPEETHSAAALWRDQWMTGEYWERHAISKRLRPDPFQKPKLTELSLQRKPWLSIRDGLHGMPSPGDKAASKRFYNHVFIPGARSYPGHTGSPIDLPSKALKAGDHGVPGGENTVVLPDGTIRYYTIREAARLQTFSDDYIFQGSWTETMRQLGNAVPVLLAEVISRDIKKHLAIISAKNANRDPIQPS
jgi:DNA (cytosine-5)-methyltransferase 1